MNEGTKEEAKGKYHKAKGEAKEAVGDLTDNPETEAEGKVEKRKGEAQEKKGQVKKALED
jgi:uncharacterized protein YjbJ (UPF0337 family)